MPLPKPTNKQLIITGIIALILVIIVLLIWPYISRGTLVLNINQSGTTLSICQTTTGYIGNSEYGCPPTAMKEIAIGSNTYQTRLAPGTYYIRINKKDHSRFDRDIAIQSWQTNQIDIDIFPNVSQLSTYPTLSLSQDYTDNSIYLIQDVNATSDNQVKFFYQVSQLKNGQFTPLYQIENHTNLTDILWSPDHTKIYFQALAKNSTDTNPHAFILNLSDKTITPSSISYDQIAWSADSQKIYYVYQNLIRDTNTTAPNDLPPGAGWIPPITAGPNHNTLTMAHPDGTNWENIISLDQDDIIQPQIIPSPDGQYIILISTNNSAYLIELNTKQIRPIGSDKNIIQASWSPDSQTIIVAIEEENGNPQIYFTNADNLSLQPTNINTYLPKTVWFDQNQLLAAIPAYLEPGKKLYDPQTIDHFFTIDLSNLSANDDSSPQKALFNLIDPIAESATSLTYDPPSRTLYFIDQNDFLSSLPQAP